MKIKSLGSLRNRRIWINVLHSSLGCTWYSAGKEQQLTCIQTKLLKSYNTLTQGAFWNVTTSWWHRGKEARAFHWSFNPEIWASWCPRSMLFMSFTLPPQVTPAIFGLDQKHRLRCIGQVLWANKLRDCQRHLQHSKKIALRYSATLLGFENWCVRAWEFWMVRC